jgi:hypothetical protein
MKKEMGPRERIVSEWGQSGTMIEKEGVFVSEIITNRNDRMGAGKKRLGEIRESDN